MSKKLMMNNYSENGLMPVIDGLTFWVDSSSLYDETFIYSNVNDFKIRKFNTVNITNNGIECVGSGTSGGSLVTYEKYDTTQGNFCIEINFKRENMIKFSTIFIQKQGGAKLYTENNSLNVYQDMYGIPNGFISNLSSDRNVVTLNISTNTSNVYLNGVKKASYNFGATTVNNCIAFNTKYLTSSSNETLDTTFISIKFYNRALSEEEIRQNYAYEQSIQRGE